MSLFIIVTGKKQKKGMPSVIRRSSLVARHCSLGIEEEEEEEKNGGSAGLGMRAEAALSRRDRGPGTASDSSALEDRIKALGEALTQTNAELAGLRRDIAGPFLLDNDEEQW